MIKTQPKLQAALIAAVSASSLHPAVAQDELSELAIEEIVVTATKRAVSLMDVGGSVSALTGDTLKEKGLEEISDVASLTPNVTLYGGDQPGRGQLVIRGVSGGSGDAGTTAASSIYIDEAVFTFSAVWSGAAGIMPDADLSDLERVEVLKGPQGTLYGANSIGGLMRMVTKKPDPSEFFGSVEAGYNTVDGGGNGHAIRGSVNIPLIEDKLAITLNAFDRNRAGVYDNVATGAEDVDESDITGGRIALRWFASDNLTLDLNAFKQSIDTDTAGFEEVFAGTKQSINGKFKHNESPNLPGEVELESFGASLNYTFDGWGTLTASISEMEFTGENIIDGLDSGPGALAFISNAVPGFTAVTTSRFGGDKLTSEIRFASDRLGNIEFMVGAYYTDEDLDSSRVLPIINPDGSSPTTFNPSFLNPMAPNVNLPFDGSVLTSNNPNTYEEEAVFANLTYYFTEEIDLTLGARSGSIEQEVNSVNTGLLAQATFNPGGLYQSDENVTNLSGVLRWRAAEDLSLYFKVAEGYRPGGPQIANPGLAPFEADEVTNYELGAKGALLDKSFTYSVSAYLMEWENTQLPGRDPLTRGIIIENGPDAEVMGVEAEFAYRPAANWLIAGNIGYNTSELIEVVDASIVISTNAEKGDPLPLTPEWAGSLDVSYNHNISNNIVGDYGVTIKSRGSANSGFPNNNGVTEIKTDTLEQVDLRAAFTFDDKYRLSLIAENVTNEAGIQSYKSGTVGYATRYRPRTIYVTAKMDF